MNVEESLNVTFDETPPPPKTSPLEDDELVEEEAIELSPDLGSNKNKRDARGIVYRNKARLVAQGHRQEKGIDYNEVFTPFARVEAIRLFLAFASYMGFMVYQMDVKSAFLNGDIQEEVYVTQPKGFEDPKQDWSAEFEALMQSQFEMSFMGQLTFFLGLQVDQKLEGIFIHQTKYVNDILHKFDMDTNKSAPTPFEPLKIKDKNLPDGPVNVHLYSLILFRFKLVFLHYIGWKSCLKCDLQYGFVPADTMSRVTWNSFLLIGSEMFHQIIDFLNGSSLRYALTENPVAYESLVRQFWTTVSTRNLPNDHVELVATIDGHEHTISEATIRTALHLDDLDAADVLPNQEIFDGLQAIGYRPASPWVYNFFRYIFQGMVSNVSGKHKFLMYPRFVQLALNITPTNTIEYVVPSFTSKVPPIAPPADEPIPDLAHAPDVEEPISSPVLEPVVQPNIASTSDPLLSKAQFDAFIDFEAQQHHDQPTGGSPTYEHPPIPNPATTPVSTTKGALEVPFTTDQMLALFLMSEAAINKPSSFVTPSKTTAADSSQNEDISPSTVEAAQILTEGKLDPSKISKSPAAVAQRSVQTFV
nr:hypothetical protein [Tanacetum cinerariifolium]